ncbi:MAG: low-specificity L-threonine aldolase [Nitrospirae bacterium]|nr:MAG: low-specificity L-threonine aldolase [Nitrospirota bacterium]
MIDLRSDTVTQPSQAMRDAMATAPVGDDVYGEDPTVNRLQEMAAALLGKAAALFVPTGIMANQLSLRVHTQPGDEVIVDSRAHIVKYEHGAAAALAGVQLHWVSGQRGILEPEQVLTAIRPNDPYNPQTRLICLENTHNSGGGSVYPLPTIQRIRDIAVARGIPMHLDGARLFNAVVASGVPAADYARHFETVSFCLSKGLGAPVGSIIVSDADTVAKLRPLRRMYGGGMRQAGILAAAGLYALEHNIARLKDDHAHAQALAGQLRKIPSVSIDAEGVETNIVVFEVTDPSRSSSEILGTLKQAGLLINSVGGMSFRAVTHLNVSAQAIEEAGRIFSRVLTR